MNIRDLINQDENAPTDISKENLKQQIDLLETNINLKIGKIHQEVVLIKASLTTIQTLIVKLEKQQEILSKTRQFLINNNVDQEEITVLEKKIQLNSIHLMNYKKSESSLVDFFRIIMSEIKQTKDFEKLNLLKSELESRDEIRTFLNNKGNKVTTITNFGLFEQTQSNNNDNNNNNNNQTPPAELARQTF